MASVSGSEISTDGPVLSLITKKLRALKKKYNRIVQLEESQAQGKTLNKEQEDLLKSKPAVSVLIDEYEKLRQPLSSALQEELSRLPAPPQPTESEEEPKASPAAAAAAAAADAPSGDLEDLLRLLYFGCLFDVKSQQEFTSIMLTRTHERGCCLTYDYVTDDATDLLGETDLDMISALGGLLTSRPVYAGVSHKNALEGCIQRAKLWLQEADEPILPGASVTYAGLREKLNKIMALDYFTMTPEMKAPVDVAAAVGKYNCQMQVPEASTAPALDDFQVDGAPVHYQPQEDDDEEFQAVEVSIDQSSPVDETENVDEVSGAIASGDSNTGYQDQERVEADSEVNQRDSEHKEQKQYIPRRPYQNQRSVRGGGGGGSGGARRGYMNGRVSRGGRSGAGGGGYQNGRGQQYYDPGYYPRNYYNTWGRGGGRPGGSGMYNNSHGGAAAHGGQVELHANS